MHALKLTIPPPAVALLMAAFMWLVAHATPSFACGLPAHRAIAGCLAVAGVLTAILAVVSFRRAGTTLNPLKPENTSALVTSGIYTMTRNPMYLGLLLVLLGWAVSLSNVLAFAFLPAFIVYMNRFQIRHEEDALRSMFGEDFLAYKARVRRWL